MRKKVFIISLLILIGISIFVVKYYNNNAINKNDITINNKDENINETEKKETKKLQAIDFKLKDINGKEVSLSQFKGKKVFLNFWATWCGYCKVEMKDIEKLYKETKDKNIVILAIDVGEKADIVKDFINKNNYSFPVLLDIDQKVTESYGIQGFPTSLFVDEEGYVYSGIQGGMTLRMMKEQLNIE
ncbi:peroxiredoxin [Clostridium tetanomorphum]|uniref:TlpA family protein disulfide reductase n=1 Tax=Clostridium tetanomorphum TaxID=1553 RepID=A0A923ED39_CLOTT|nr:TlpA disulfide reductase family protein [Clostridium tetanomorphum]KAJ53087.1 thiol:disulfide interchange protein TlpA [Clostridium tetanomorphum DSM 665]MBC2398375.1 TlpA family protein disulfide reductase [Clostridium tetanomorphum]MBP1865528.1 peroxiredoxin [Clostridium tetanomorphum]NRS86474.1 peroxiredoxin [Clostridium tetanomorphum]NRZ95497.1 peroxiredoxin [Clostridium tetanomorphum]